MSNTDKQQRLDKLNDRLANAVVMHGSAVKQSSKYKKMEATAKRLRAELEQGK